MTVEFHDGIHCMRSPYRPLMLSTAGCVDWIEGECTTCITICLLLVFPLLGRKLFASNSNQLARLLCVACQRSVGTQTGSTAIDPALVPNNPNIFLIFCQATICPLAR
jgi:hypothetical protein